jgi:hypothetical protein
VSRLVLDAGAELLLDTVLGRSIEARLPQAQEWWVPEHYYLEVAGVRRRFEARQLVTPARSAAAFSKLQADRLRRVQVRPLLASAWPKRGHLTSR